VPNPEASTSGTTSSNHPGDTFSGVSKSEILKIRHPARYLRTGSAIALIALVCQTLTPLQAAAVKQQIETEISPNNSKCKSKDAGKTRSGGSLVCIRSATTYSWSKVFAQNDVIQFADFCSKYLTVALCGSLERTAYLWIDSRARGADQCVRLLRQWVYQIKTDLDSGVLNRVNLNAKFGGATYYDSKLIPITRSFPGCWEPNK